ncbi:MAG TPA: 16S rRNA (cytosine(1402)-N(4))-methyltransferase RsmH [Pseudobdellovibrionaceae bacterium]|nr:16S rRNA (cytosine(1402)-N(4))-methyltransferase RsmH [Pseudobdellovibrionaceae bacterium]
MIINETKIQQNPHIPIMVHEILEMFSHQGNQDLRYLDGTFGRGGHFSAIKQAYPGLHCEAFDQDEEAIQYAINNFSTEVQSGQLKIHHDNFSKIKCYNLKEFDFILLDLGVSSPQLDQGERGFSFYHDGPLDMRMNQKQEFTAADIINEYSEEDLITVFQKYGEVRKPYRVVRAIVHDRKTKPYSRTREISELIARVDGWRIKGQHPATQYFMALRLHVNRELDVLSESLRSLMELLKPDGKMAVLTFHSLEDRIVKNIFKDSKDLGSLVNKKVIVASRDEALANPRSRSAKLRVFQRSTQDESTCDKAT